MTDSLDLYGDHITALRLLSLDDGTQHRARFILALDDDTSHLVKMKLK